METLHDLEFECAKLRHDADTMLLSARLNKMAKRILEHSADYPLLSEVLEGLVHASSCRVGHYPHSRPDRFSIAKRVAGQAEVVGEALLEADVHHLFNLVPAEGRAAFLTGDGLGDNAEEFPALNLHRFPNGDILRQLGVWEAIYAEDMTQYSVVQMIEGHPVEVFPGRKYTYSQAMSMVRFQDQVHDISTVIARLTIHEVKGWNTALNL